MNREFLKEQGLTDEQIESVMKEHGKTLNETKSKADRVDGLESQIEDLEGQIDDRDTQLKKLKEIDPEALQAEIERLESENEKTAEDFKERLEKQAKDFAIDSYLRDQKARNPKAVKGLLDLESITLKDGKLIGIDEQVTPLKESDDYLFGSEGNQNTTPRIVAGGNPNGGGSGALTRQDIMKETDNTKRQRLISENAHLFK